MAATDQDPRNPHDLAVDIQTDLQKLATYLAHAGASPQAVSQLTKMAEVMGQVVKVLGGSGPQPGPQEAGPPGQPQPQAGPPQPQAQPGPPQPQAGPPQGQPQGPPSAGHQALHAATHALHAAMIASKSAAQPGR